jgi:DNA primase
MMISQNKIDEILSTADIVDVISQYIVIKKRGKNYVGLCPFHSEKTPSFSVSGEKQIYHCFGCHSGGNAIKFLMEYQKLSFIEAVRELAKQLGITIEEEEMRDGKLSEYDLLYELNSEIGKHFLDNLLKEKEADAARAYFENRKIKTATIRAFGLGYAIPGGKLLDYIEKNKLDVNRSLNLGIISKNNDGSIYDKFSGRIIFPIFSHTGRVAAFAGRILNDQAKAAKYLNSPESKIYYKGKILYGLSHAKDEIRRNDKAIIVEGYMDLLALYQNGIKNVVAVSGTALTEDQIQLLSRFTKNVVLIFDSDTAGIKASMRSIELLLKQNMEIKIASLPQGEDPDSFINKSGKNEFQNIINEGKNFLEYQFEYYRKEGMLDEPSKQAEAVREAVKFLSLVGDELKRSFYLKNISKKFDLRESLLEKELSVLQTRVSRGDKKEIRRREEKEIAGTKVVKERGALYNIEKEIIRILLEGEKKSLEFILHNLTPEEISDTNNSEIFKIILTNYNNGEDISLNSILNRIEDQELSKYILELTFEKHSISQIWEQINPGPTREKIIFRQSLDSVKNFRMKKFDHQIKKEELKLDSDDYDPLEILAIINELHKEKKLLQEQMDEKNYI